MRANILFTIFFLITIPTTGEDQPQDPFFPTPAIIKDNVAFWKKIYSEISLTEGVIHDRDYPAIIYERLNGTYTTPKVKTRKESITASLRTMASTPRSRWTNQENEIFTAYINGNGDTTDFKGAAERIRFQQGQKERFREGLERSGQYLDTIRAILTEYKVPLRLAYLPHVESSFNTEAYSKVGAAGLWQFMRGTGKMYGMKIDYSIDERRDPLIATVAAAKYLSSSYAVFKAWPLAITSYNHGVGGMKRAVAQTGSSDLGVIIEKYSSRSFRFASSNFYGCFIAASEIAENYKAYFPDVTLDKPIRYTSVKLAQYIKPSVLCSTLGITLEEFANINLALRPVVFEQNKQLPKGFVIHLPNQITSELALTKINAIPDSLKQFEPERPKYYSVNRGDNLYAIASRLGVSVKDIALENNITKYNRIYAGQVLRVPETVVTTTQLASVTQKQASEKDQLKNQPKTVETIDSTSIEAAVEIAEAELALITPPEEPTTVVKIPAKQPEKSSTTTPVVQTPVKTDEPVVASSEQLSDSLKDIALAPALSEPETNPNIKPVRFMNFDISLYNLDATLASSGSNALIYVSIDETIGHYADWLGIPTSRIRKLNDMGRTSTIRVNQKLRIPVDQIDALENFSAARLEYHMAIEEDFYAQYMVSDVKAHTVQRGQTLWDLCNVGETPLPLWVLNKYNKQVDLNRIVAGMTVWLPIISELTQEEIERREKTNMPPLDQPYRQPFNIVPTSTRRIP